MKDPAPRPVRARTPEPVHEPAGAEEDQFAAAQKQPAPDEADGTESPNQSDRVTTKTAPAVHYRGASVQLRCGGRTA